MLKSSLESVYYRRENWCAPLIKRYLISSILPGSGFRIRRVILRYGVNDPWTVLVCYGFDKRYRWRALDWPRRSFGPAAEHSIKSKWYSDKIFFKHMFELEFRARNSKVGLPIVVLQTDKLCSTVAYDRVLCFTKWRRRSDELKSGEEQKATHPLNINKYSSKTCNWRSWWLNVFFAEFLSRHLMIHKGTLRKIV